MKLRLLSGPASGGVTVVPREWLGCVGSSGTAEKSAGGGAPKSGGQQKAAKLLLADFCFRLVAEVRRL